MAEIKTWPGWEYVRELGVGSFGKVYEIQRVENGKIFKSALKVISIPQNYAELENAYSEGMDQNSITKYFQSVVSDITNEVALMSDLKGYTNIVSYEDHMVVPHQNSVGWDILIRMELLTPLLKWAAENTMTESDVIRLGCDMCRALELCHKNKIIHRDIKPQNIFVNRNGDFKLGDFGIARVAEKTSSVMSQKGTYIYMAPEVFQGQHYNETADIYSLGIVLYRFLNQNRMPFLPMGELQYSDRQEALNKRMSGEQIPAPMNGNPMLKQVVLMTLRYQPNQRFSSAAALRNALEKCRAHDYAGNAGAAVPMQQEQTVSVQRPETYAGAVHGQQTSPVIPVNAEPEGKPVTKKKSLWIIPVAVVLVLLLIGAGFFAGRFMKDSAGDEGTRAEREALQEELDSEEVAEENDISNEVEVPEKNKDSEGKTGEDPKAATGQNKPDHAIQDQIFCDAQAQADYSMNLDPSEYSYYSSESCEGFALGYPSNLYNEVWAAENTGSDEYGITLEEIYFSGSDNYSTALFQLKQRENSRTVAEETQRLYGYYEENLVGFEKLIYTDEAGKPGRFIAVGYTDGSMQASVYLLVTITEENIMTMRVSFPFSEDRETMEYKQKEYVVECMYRMCGFSGSSYKARTYQQFLAGDSGEKYM